MEQGRVHWINTTKADLQEISLAPSLDKIGSLSSPILTSELRKNPKQAQTPAIDQLYLIQNILDDFEKGKEVSLDLYLLLADPQHLKQTFELLNKLLPTIPLGKFEKCVVQYLKILLEASTQLYEYQIRLAHTISERYLQEKNLKEAMRYSAIALNITHQYQLDTADIEEVQSLIFLSFLEKQHDRIKTEFQEAISDPSLFHQKLKELLSFKRYCRNQRSLEKIKEIFTIPQTLLANQNHNNRQQLISSNPLIT